MDEKSIRQTFPQKFIYYMQLHGKKRNDLVRDLGYKYSTIRDWEKGITIPRMDKVEQLANYFGILKSDLIEDKQNEPTEQITLSSHESNLIKKYRALDERGKQAVDDTLEREYEFVKPKTEESAIS